MTLTYIYPNLNISGVPIDITKGWPIYRLDRKPALQHSTFHLLDSTTSLFIVSTLKMMMVVMMMVMVVVGKIVS